MAIINFLPQFKVVEPNRLTGLVMGHVISQFPLNPDFAGIIDDYQYDMVENGFILGLGSELEVDEYDPSRHAQPFLLFNEELNTFFDGLKWYATGADEQDSLIYPRLIGLYPGDSFTTNNYDGTYTNQKFAKVIDGKLNLQEVANAQTMFAVEESTLPTGDLALRFTYIASFGTAEPSAPQASINDVEAVITASVDNNTITTSTAYSNVTELPDAWITDAFLTFDEEIPEGTEVEITIPSIGGDPVAITVAANTPIWLSDLIKDQNDTAPTRTKLNGHTSPQAFSIEVSGLDATGKLTLTVISSSAAGLAGTRQSTNPITNFVTLATKVIEEAVFAEL